MPSVTVSLLVPVTRQLDPATIRYMVFLLLFPEASAQVGTFDHFCLMQSSTTKGHMLNSLHFWVKRVFKNFNVLCTLYSNKILKLFKNIL